jgi:hypothetical protein
MRRIPMGAGAHLERVDKGGPKKLSPAKLETGVAKLLEWAQNQLYSHGIITTYKRS